MGNLVVTAKIGNHTMTKHTKVSGPPRFSVIFKRLANYEGEYGFDDVIRNYEHVCKNVDELKKVYLKKAVYGKEYYVPWISMFPNHESVVGKKVTLKLELENTEGSIKNHDLIVIPPKNGIRFEPSEFRAADFGMPQEVTVYCDQPLTSDTVVEVYQRSKRNKDMNTEVGYLHFLKNAKTYNFNIRIVKVLRDKSKDADLQTINSALASVDLENYLNKKSLQQALIQTKIEDEVEMEIDTKKLEEEGYLKGDTIVEETGKPNIKNHLVKLYQNSMENSNSFKGVIVLVVPIPYLTENGEFSGFGKIFPTNNRECMIFKRGINDPRAYAHEIGHVLGLNESFTDIEKEREELLNRWNKAIVNYKKYLQETIPEHETWIRENIEYYEKKYNNELNRLSKINLLDSEKSISKKNKSMYLSKINEFHKKSAELKKSKNEADLTLARLDKEKKEINIINSSNTIGFDLSQTDNLMDYTENLPSYRFYYQQWSVIQMETKKYYGY